MSKKIQAEKINELIDEIEAETQGGPMIIERTGKPDYTLIATSVFNDIIDRLHKLEEAVKTDEERHTENDNLVEMMKRSE